MNYSHQEETIIAQATSKMGAGALALIRLSGADCYAVIDRISTLASKKTLSQASTHTIHYGTIKNSDQEPIDHVLFMIMRAPKSFTGENTLEITCHNNPFIIEAIIAEAVKAGARIAQEGEFSRRAVHNKKIDIIQAEAINDLITANTQYALKKSLAQLEGTLSSWISLCEERLLKAFAFCDASFEFLDEEISFSSTIKSILEELLVDIQKNKKSFNQQESIRQGIRIALIGSVNSGKSSLFNALLGTARAIVTNQAGTTRDTLEAGMYKNSMYLTLIDTAGLRTTQDVIEKEGIKRSFQEAHKADIILLVFDGARSVTQEEEAVYAEISGSYAHKIIKIQNKSDLNTNNRSVDTTFLQTSTINQSGLAELELFITVKIQALFDSLDSPFLLNKRHHAILISLEKKIREILNLLDSAVQYEIVSYHLKDALVLISELTGKSISENGMDAIFKQFCVGK